MAKNWKLTVRYGSDVTRQSFDDLDEVVAVMPDGRRSELKIEDHFFQNGRVILKIVGFDSIESGETLRGAEICVAETDVVELDQGEFFEWQLAG